MIVLDSSALIELLLRSPKSRGVIQTLDQSGGVVHAPHLIDIEVLHVLRRFNLMGGLPTGVSDRALRDLGLMTVVRYPQVDLIERIWELRFNLSAYDAAYVALAEVLSAPLLTCDARLAAAPGHRARIELVS